MKWVLGNVQIREVFGIAEIFRDGTGEIVAAEVNISQIGQETKTRRNRPVDLIVLDSEA